jgi:hypothetical protein
MGPRLLQWRPHRARIWAAALQGPDHGGDLTPGKSGGGGAAGPRSGEVVVESWGPDCGGGGLTGAWRWWWPHAA